MISDNMKGLIEQLINTERGWAVKMHWQFNSMHEGYAVALEEWDELMDEIRGLEDGFPKLWEAIKDDSAPYAYIRHLDGLKETAVRAIAELIQFAAMLEKMDDYLTAAEPDSHKSAKEALESIEHAAIALGRAGR